MLSGVGYDYKSDPIVAQIFVYEVLFGVDYNYHYVK